MWANIILYMTSKDSDLLRNWLNGEDSVAWIVSAGQSGFEYRWRAVDSLESLVPGAYYLWHKTSGPLNVPSGSLAVADAIVLDPYAGWTQRMHDADARSPWFGANLPGPCSLRFVPEGREAAGSIGRSEFAWPGDYYRCIGKPAQPAAKAWWRRLGRFVRSQSTRIPWPSPDVSSRSFAYAFPDAYAEILRGRPYDINP